MPKYNPNIHHRRSIRLKKYDYSQAGLYFITICVQNRECLFGHITVGAIPCGCPDVHDCLDINDYPQNTDYPEMILNDTGKMVKTEWLNLKNRFPNIELHEYVVMPNHFHAILEIMVPRVDDQIYDNRNGQGQPQGIAPTNTPTKTVGDIIGAFKSITTVEYIRGVKNLAWKPFDGKLWQHNYYEHLIRNEKSYENIAEYILNNPAKWHMDELYVNKEENEGSKITLD